MRENLRRHIIDTTPRPKVKWFYWQDLVLAFFVVASVYYVFFLK